jgi:SecY interacting protein Syd
MPQTEPLKYSTFSHCLDNFFKRFIHTVYTDTAQLPIIPFESDWPSLCHQGDSFSQHSLQMIQWQPIQRESNQDFSGLEKALEITLRPEVALFFNHYWSEQINAIFEQGNLTLLFVCNANDMNRLIENQLGHALNKLRNKQPLTFFIACTQSDYIISVEHDSGNVILERLGYPIEKILADDLNQFMNALEYGQLSVE